MQIPILSWICSQEMDRTQPLFFLQLHQVDGAIMVFVDGVFQREGSSNAWTLSGDTVTFTAACKHGKH